MNSKIVISLILLALVLIFIVQNTTVVKLQFLWWSMEMSRSLLIFFVLAIGIAMGWLLASHFMHRRAKG